MGVSVTTTATQLAMLTQMAGAGGAFHLTELRLFANDYAPDHQSVPLSFVEPTFDGYSAAAGQVFGASYIAPDGLPRITAPSVQFTCTGSTVLTDTVYGWYLVNTGGTTVIMAQRFDNPVPITSVGDGVIVLPDYAYGE